MTVELRRIRVCAVDDVPSEEGRVVRIADRPIAIFRSGAAVYALDNTCTHMGGRLADGIVAQATVACPLHERRFDLASGQAVGHSCGAVAAYPVEVIDGDVLITIPVFSGAASAVALGTVTGTDVTDSADESALERKIAADADLVGDQSPSL